jgi:Tetracyclin repressor-like, C-terminal domain
VLKGTRARLPGDLAEELPTLLWLYHMGIVLFWIHDSSPKQIKTWRLMEQTTDSDIK